MGGNDTMDLFSFWEFDQALEGTNVIDWIIIGSILSFVDHEIADRCQSALHIFIPVILLLYFT